MIAMSNFLWNPAWGDWCGLMTEMEQQNYMFMWGMMHGTLSEEEQFAYMQQQIYIGFEPEGGFNEEGLPLDKDKNPLPIDDYGFPTEFSLWTDQMHQVYLNFFGEEAKEEEKEAKKLTMEEFMAKKKMTKEEKEEAAKKRKEAMQEAMKKAMEKKRIQAERVKQGLPPETEEEIAEREAKEKREKDSREAIAKVGVF